ncbi:hypothetical protein C0J52_17216 [Blattella germanica]|nr:hypothetical protein C0J52_17216 [Blattella germanica]
MNSIGALLNTPFSSLSYENKLKIKQLGRPTPVLNIIYKQESEKVNRWRKFNPDIYKKYKWLSGCEHKNAFFCFPCVLFHGESPWSKVGVTDLVHLKAKIKKHENSKEHMNNVMSLSMLGKMIQNKLNSEYRQAIDNHNEKVKKNRRVLNLIIDCIRFCGALELTLQGHNESENSENKVVFRELIDFSAKFDEDLKEHLNKSSVFTGMSKTIQNDLLECMLKVYHDEVRKEINSVDYVAVIADDTTDVSTKVQLAMLLRYIIDGKPQERFWKFLNSTGHNASAFSECILTELEPIIGNSPNKLIAQTFDGASVMRGESGGVQKLLKDKYEYANFVHCHAHQANLVMSKAGSINRQARIFFSNLSGICSFFSNSSQRTGILDAMVQGRLPQGSNMRWNFQSHGLNTVFEYRKDLIYVMEAIENDEAIMLQSTLNQASSYKLMLNDDNFLFWLTLFHRIMPHMEIIFSQLQKRCIDPVKVRENLHNFELSIQSIREQVDTILQEVEIEQNSTNVGISSKRRRCEVSCDEKRRQALEVCDSIVLEIKSRFQFTGHLVAERLFAVEEFENYSRQFPNSYLHGMVKKYPFLEENKLKCELQVCYSRLELRTVYGALSFLTLILDDELCDTFQETVKLLKLLITMPMSTSEAERCFSTMKRIKTFLRNTMGDESLSALGMLSCEKSFINNIVNFNQKVIEEFTSKEERCMDFHYHSC